MEKKYLETGMYVVLRDGSVCVITLSRNVLTNIQHGTYSYLDNYDDELNHATFSELDIVKVYDNYEMKTLIWEKISLTNDEKTLLRNLFEDYEYIARDKSGALYIFKSKPIKEDNECWIGDQWAGFYMYNHLFQFIKWEDEVPYSISDLLGE